MSQVIGTYTKLLLCPEKDFKVAPTALDGKVKSLPYNTNGFSASQNTTDPATITGRRDATEAIYGNLDASGDIVVPLDSNAFGWWLAFAFGSPTTTEATDGNTYTHVFKPGETQPSAIVEKAAPKQKIFLKTNGCKVSKLSFSFGGDGELTATVSLSGCKEENDTAILGTPEDIPMKRFNNFQIGSLKIGGKEVSIVTQATLDIDFGLDTDGYAIGDEGYRSRLNEGVIKPSGQVTAFFDDMTLLDQAMSNTETSLELTLTNSDGEMTIKVPELKFARNTPAIDGIAGISQQLDYSGYYGDNADNTCIMFTLKNKTASYAFAG